MKVKTTLRKEIFFYFLVFGIILFGIVKGTFSKGDFIGYILTGKALALEQPIYSVFENTWPPLFSIFCLPLSIISDATRPILYFLWLIATTITFFWIIRFSFKFFFNKNWSLFKKEKNISLVSTVSIIPVFLIVKFLLDNMVNVQINIFFLAACLLTVSYYTKEKYWLVGLLLALTISLKVYTIFFLFYFIYKRAWKVASWTVLFLIASNLICYLYWGVEVANANFLHWIQEVVPYRSDFVDHKNQSIFGTFFRFFTTLDPGHDMYVYIADIAPEVVKKMTVAAVAVAAIVPIYLFRKKIESKSSLISFLEYSIVFTALPILSPMSWKAYFIFLWVPIFLLSMLLYQSNFSGENSKWLKVTFIIANVLLIGSSDMFTGIYFSDVLESYSSYTLGAVLLIVIQLVIYYQLSEKGKIITFKI